ncbi:hypothetical protein ASPZODRAFT_57859 [Penicilliopsis zonata CBS 506.65]|uniref:Major facilitator superfamily (MFS) profile domain-containing protein n=1 Tax=Penicilliopsis zonata CBS 506.65 TaxID=1073090 RepID=A0A1L9STF6_9EURO|nr:hypothetical protein ASPZODRAFT_57859 [Penicilliopsis zonata CBS 506.65]OJJ50416.1 hypothetical protein ASPZODRAFT_57859 [Penicilliopsis zonata CBS 506.65]
MDPPGTVRLEDRQGDHLVLSPQPSADPNEPLNWSTPRKVLHMTLLCLYTVFVFATVTVITPVWQDLLVDRGFSYTTLNNADATNFAALSVGCYLFVPFALRFGRRQVYILTALIMFAVGIWQANMKTLGDLFGSQVVGGLAGAVNESLFQVTVADLFFVHQRGTMNGIYLIMVTIGNSLGPVASGYVAANQGWQWSFWWCAIFMGITAVLMIFFLEESKYDYPQAMDETASTVNGSTTTAATKEEASTAEKHIPEEGGFDLRRFLTHYSEPIVMLYTFPTVAFTAIQYGFNIACLAILVITQATIYPEPPYDMSSIAVGNMEIPAAIGSLLGALFGGPLIDYFLLLAAKRNGGIYEPEMRLYLYCVPALFMAAGVLMYGLTIAKGMPWIINGVGSAFMGAGLGGMCDMSLAYLQDSYRGMVGDALVPVAFVRNICGTILAFAIPYWMDGMGTYNMFVLLGCLSLALSALHIPMIIYGKRSRERCADKYYAYLKRN